MPGNQQHCHDKENLERALATEFGWTEFISPYLPLPTPTSIRLLKVHPGLPITCHFTLVDLDHAPTYSALSYTWSNPRGLLPPDSDIETDHKEQAQTHLINLNGEAVKITHNLFTFLEKFRTMRQTCEQFVTGAIQDSDIEYIWIDAICINQHSLDEQARQVKIMDRVYRQAKKVLVWLGPEDAYTKIGFEAMHKLKDAYAIYQPTKDTSQEALLACAIGDRFGPLKANILARMGLPNITTREWCGVLSLYRRSWFSRAWTVQEFALSRDAIFLCGEFSMSWELWRDVTKFLVQSGWQNEAMNIDFSFDASYNPRTEHFLLTNSRHHELDTAMIVIHGVDEPFDRAVTRLMELRVLQREDAKRRWMYEVGNLPLQTILATMSCAQASRVEDYVYAYLGLLPGRSWEGLEIDYTRSLVQTFTQTTWAMIKATRSLSILSLVQHERRTVAKLSALRDLPSWVPDYCAYRRSRALDPGCRRGFGGQPAGVFKATRGSKYDFEIPDTLSPKLIVRGHKYSVLEYVQYRGEAWEVDDLVCLQQSSRILEYIRKAPPDAFWRMLISDQDTVDHTTPASAQCGLDMFQAWANWLSIMLMSHDADSENGIIENRQNTSISSIRCALESYMVITGGFPSFEVVSALKNFDFTRLSLDELRRYIDMINKDWNKIAPEVNGTTVNLVSMKLHKMVSALRVTMVDRHIFVTRGGSIGKGSTSAHPGDEIWLLHGANVPHVLRSQGNGCYSFVGEAYVRGIMQGEAFNGTDGASMTISIG